MTQDRKNTDQSDENASLSLLPEASMEIRVRPADFARMVQVSKQTVSQWIKRGIVTLGSDGRLEPKEAVRQIIQNTDPARLRAKVLRPLVDDVQTLRKEIQARDKRIEYLERFWREIEQSHEIALGLIVNRWEQL